ncbi:triphosphoribosyl-dephospho-CoA synthase [Thermococcus stetteri]|uniref:triphosphoribosyl-dephospho-CoA synthase n=1 Tax=Thermococcus stetteri TaxID=49900 RepID=UPI001AE575A9|nr:triphosphoribosyl-dephospho-CoA synthase [Thermococcus stetteri]MBP1911033.1 triphosphoribosyl-dephospho-CoA synthase [Thermococcus stetteri]
MERWRIVRAFLLGPLLEATLPKPGNVNRYHDFRDLTIYNFLFADTALVSVYYEAVRTAELIRGGELVPSETGIGTLIKRAVKVSKETQDANPNFGVLVLGIPLAMGASLSKNVMEAGEKAKELIRASTVRDTMDLYQAIRMANPKGMVKGVQYDVYSDEAFNELFRDGVNLWMLAEMSCGRELVFCEWLTGYELTYTLAERLFQLIKELPLEDAVVRAFLELLSSSEDTLIVRKAGKGEAKLVMEKAKAVLDGGLTLEEFDAFLREKGDLRNPGSLADIMAASLSVLALAGLKIKVVDGKAWGVMEQP